MKVDVNALPPLPDCYMDRFVVPPRDDSAAEFCEENVIARRHDEAIQNMTGKMERKNEGRGRTNAWRRRGEASKLASLGNTVSPRASCSSFSGKMEIMKRTLACILLMICVNGVADSFTTSRQATHRQTRILAQQYVTELVDATFDRAPKFDATSDQKAPLAISAACRIAQKEFDRLREPGITYALKSVTLFPFHESGHWYYLVLYRAADDAWKEFEPYKSIKEKDGEGALVAPRIGITILLDGSIVAQTPVK